MITKMTDSERKKSYEIDQWAYTLAEMVYDRFSAFAAKTTDLTQVVHTPKGKNGSEWGYYVSHNIGRLAVLLKKNKIKSFIDLGCGAGVLLRVLTMYIPYISVRGIDNEEKLVSYCNRFMAHSAKQGNILSLKREDVERYQVIYFYEPLRSEKLAQQFVENLSKIVTEGQHILYFPAGSIGKFLSEAKNVKRINRNTGPWQIYKVTKTL